MPLFLTMLITLACGIPAHTATANLLRNPGFEEGAARLSGENGESGEAFGWTYRFTGGTGYIWPASAGPDYMPLAPVETGDGKECVRFASQSGSRVELFQEVPINGGLPYTASVLVRAQDADGMGFGTVKSDSAALVVNQLDSQGRVIGPATSAAIRSRNDRFGLLQADFVSDKRARSVRFRLVADIGCNYWHGMVKYDSCRLEQSGPAPAAQPVALGVPSERKRYRDVPVGAPEVCIARLDGPPVLIIADPDDEQLRRTVLWCRDFLKVRGYPVVERSAAGEADGFQWRLAVTGQTVPDGAGAFVLKTGDSQDAPSLEIRSSSPSGVRAGVARLVGLLRQKESGLYAPRLELRTEPFYTGRRLNLSYEWPSWDDERVRKLVEAAWLFGYNSVEFPYIKTGLRDKSEDEVHKELAADRARYRKFMETARSYDLRVSQVFYAQSFFFFGRMDEGNLGALCWYNPEDRALIERQIVWKAENFGDLVDNVTVHVSDPGGCDCDGCDPYVTCQEVAAVIQSEYRKVNPDVTVTLSTWAHPRFWRGHPDAVFLDDSHMPRDIGIALHRWYSRDLARLVRGSGRELDIWGWYLGDYEGEWDFFLNMTTIDRYYRALPAEAADDVRVMTQELCFPGRPQIINAYVAAQKMWSPARDLFEIEREFCSAVFGEENADSMVSVYGACEKYVHPGRYDYFIPPTDCPTQVIGTSEYNRELRAALEAGTTVDLETAPPQLLPTPTDRKELYDRLMGHLSIILIGSEALEAIETAKKRGATQDELQQIVDNALAKGKSLEKTQIDWMPSEFHLKWGHTSLSQRVKDAAR